MNKILSTYFFATLLLLVGCAEKHSIETPLSSQKISFEITETNNGWQTRSGDRVATEYADVYRLSGSKSSKPMFLHTVISDNPNISQRGEATRAAAVGVSNFYDSFGVLTYVYSGSWSEAICTPSYMYNVAVTRASNWTTSYEWPASDSKVRFFAYAPYNASGVALSSESVTGTPTLTYTVPSAVASQNDLLVAASGEIAGRSSASATLSFSHALTAVRFASKNILGTITKVSLKGVYSTATMAIGSGVWSNLSTPVTFSQTLSTTVTGTLGEEITSDEATFMMLPQTLPAGAEIEIVYTNNSGVVDTLSASIGGGVWGNGSKQITYNIEAEEVNLLDPESGVTPIDPDFLAEIENLLPSTSGEGVLTPSEVAAVTEITITDSGVNSLEGIEHFTGLENLVLDNNGGLSNLDLTNNTNLKNLELSNTPNISELDLSANTNLESLVVNNSNLSGLDLSANTNLKSLECNNNNAEGFTSLDLSANTSLESLECTGNSQLTELNLTGCSNLTTLTCENNSKLAEVNLSDNSELETLQLDNSWGLSSLNLQGCTGLTEFNCLNTALTTLDLSTNTNLRVLNCNYNYQLRTIDVSGCLNLREFNCFNSVLSSLDLSANVNLTTIDCDMNWGISSLDLSANTKLESIVWSHSNVNRLTLPSTTTLTVLDCSNNQINTGLNISGNTGLQSFRCDGNQANVWTPSSALQVIAWFDNNNIPAAFPSAANPTYYSWNGITVSYVLP
ncbi:MAG: fimbrillin family protein [Rikenellaceae bacterium]|nr:fimbrillin family protein [Rikenellaceae bacterium]